jgi:hypothetical protein
MSRIWKMDTNEGYREATRSNPALVSFARSLDITSLLAGKSCKVSGLGENQPSKGNRAWVGPVRGCGMGSRGRGGLDGTSTGCYH